MSGPWSPSALGGRSPGRRRLACRALGLESAARTSRLRPRRPPLSGCDCSSRASRPGRASSTVISPTSTSWAGCSPSTRSRTSSTWRRRRSSARPTRRRSRPSRRTSAAPGPCSRPAAGPTSPAVVVAASDKAYGPTTSCPTARTPRSRRATPTTSARPPTDLIARSYWHTYGLPVAVTRFANLYGGGDLNFSRPDSRRRSARCSTAAAR